MSKRLLLAGYFGCGNLGDDAILMGFVKSLPTGYQVSVLCKYPETLMRDYGLRGVPRRDKSAIKAALENCDALVFPGGSIFQDVTSQASVKYYSDLVGMAKKAGKKVALLGQGVGPLTKMFGKRWALSAFNSADVVVVRDQKSVDTLKALGYQGTPRSAADMAFLLPEPTLPEDSKPFGAGGMRSVGIAARPWGKGKDVIELFAEVTKRLYSKQFLPVMIEMDRHVDGPLIDAISKKNGGKVPELRKLNGPKSLQERIMRMDSVIAMRLHAGILAASVGIPPYLVSYDPKVNALANQLGFSAPPSIEGLTPDRLVDGFLSFVQERDRTVESLRAKRASLADQARANIDALESLLA